MSASAPGATTATALDRWVDRFLAYVAAERGLSPNTVAAYARDLTQLTRWLAGRADEPTDLTSSLLQAFLASERERGLAPRSATRVAATLRGFGRYLVLERALPASPAADLTMRRVPNALPLAPDRTEVQALLDTPPADTPRGRRERALSHLTITRPGGVEHVDDAYDLRCYDHAQWRRLVAASALTHAGSFDARGRPLPPGQWPYQLEALRRR